MDLTQLKEIPNEKVSSRLKRKAEFLKLLLAELSERKLPDSTKRKINDEINSLNFHLSEKSIKTSHFTKAQYKILNILEQETGLVPKNHYKQKWMGIGMAVFGIPLGVVFGTTQGNMAFIGIGIPIGLVMGVAIGSQKDKKAKEEGKQLQVDIM